MTWMRLEMRPQLVICRASGRYRDMSRIAPSVMTIASGLSSALKEAESASMTWDCLKIRRLGVPESATACMSDWFGRRSTLSSSSPKRAQQARVWATSMRTPSYVDLLSSKLRLASWSSAFEWLSSAGGSVNVSTLTNALRKGGK